ncbi:hypothetical protein UM707_10340 [Staphylococcus aureus]|nr:hypothetical protein UM707_10340 [Staphylococcus aureus]
MKYDGIQQDEYLLNSNMLGVKTSDKLKRLGKVAFLITSLKVGALVFNTNKKGGTLIPP